MWLWFIVSTAGALGQFIDAVGGMGFGAFSGSIMVASGISPAMVVGTVNLSKVGGGLISGLSHWHCGNIRWSWIAPLAIPGVAGGIFAALLITGLPDRIAHLWVPVILLMVGFLILSRFLLRSVDASTLAGANADLALVTPKGRWQRIHFALDNIPSSLKLGSIGLLGGILNGLSGAFGPFTTSTVMIVKGQHPRYAVGTVNFVEFFVAAAVLFTLFSQFNWHEFRWDLSLALMAGSMVTAPLGAYLSRRLPARALGVVVGLVLIGLNLWSILRVVV